MKTSIRKGDRERSQEEPGITTKSSKLVSTTFRALNENEECIGSKMGIVEYQRFHQASTTIVLEPTTRIERLRFFEPFVVQTRAEITKFMEEKAENLLHDRGTSLPEPVER